MNLLDPDYVCERLNYDAKTGEITWRTSVYKSRIGKIAGGLNSDGYIQIYLKGRFYRAHRVAWVIMTGSWPAQEVDHKNMVRADNRWENLREANKSDNAKNTGIRSDNKSGYKGVCWDRDRRKWRADIKLPHVRKHLGLFNDPELAHRAYVAAVQTYYGEFGRTS